MLFLPLPHTIQGPLKLYYLVLPSFTSYYSGTSEVILPWSSLLYHILFRDLWSYITLIFPPLAHTIQGPLKLYYLVLPSFTTYYSGTSEVKLPCSPIIYLILFRDLWSYMTLFSHHLPHTIQGPLKLYYLVLPSFTSYYSGTSEVILPCSSLLYLILFRDLRSFMTLESFYSLTQFSNVLFITFM